MHLKILLAISLILASTVNAKVTRENLIPLPPPSSPAAAHPSHSAPPSPPPPPSHSSNILPSGPTSNIVPASSTSPAAATATPTVPSSSIGTTSQSSAPSTTAPVVPPPPQTDCQSSVPQAAPESPPPCPNGCTWPALDVPPPIADQWLSLVDQTKIPPAPQNGVDANNVVVNNNGYTLDNDPFCSWVFTGCLRNETDISSCPGSNVWGITYDDGPQPPSPILHDYLASVNQKATLFVIGSRAVEYPSALLKAYQDGHQIAVHTWSHPFLTTQSTDTIIAEIKWTEMVIQAITGVRPRYFRAPHGDIDDRIRYIVESLGYKIIQWDRDTMDWMLNSPQTYHMDPSWVTANFSLWAAQDKNQPRGIITLEHENSLDAVCEAQRSYVIMRNAGWTPLPIADCLSDPNYYFEGGPPESSPSQSSQSSSRPQSSITGSFPSQIKEPISGALRLVGSTVIGYVGVLVVLVAIRA